MILFETGLSREGACSVSSVFLIVGFFAGMQSRLVLSGSTNEFYAGLSKWDVFTCWKRRDL